MASKRKAAAMASTAPDEPVDPADELMFLCLGGGNEVGRSCHIIQYKGKTVMVRLLELPWPSNSVVSANSSGSSTPASTPPTMDWPPSLSLMISTSAPSTCSSSASKLYSPVLTESKLSRHGLGKARGKRGRGTGCSSTRSRRFAASEHSPSPLCTVRP